MQFVLQRPTEVHSETVWLQKLPWDDFGFDTKYRATHLSPTGAVHVLGGLKILSRAQPLPERFTKLDENYCSLGQSYQYYSNLESTLRTRISNYLTAIRDVAHDKTYAADLQKLPAFEKSLVRHTVARRLFVYGRSEKQTSPPPAFQFTCRLHGFSAAHVIDIDFRAQPRILDRIIAFTGNNGTGKTGALSQLAYALSGEQSRTSSFHPSPPSLRRVIVVSYSSFQPFKSTTSESDAYRFCGFSGTWDKENELTLAQRFRRAFQTIVSGPKGPVLKSLWSEFARDAGLSHSLPASTPEMLGLLATMSSGQRIFAQVLVEVLDGLAPGSLLLLDEPELHLHPILTSMLMRSLAALLKKFHSWAIVATHSPLILQQIPSSHIRIFRLEGRLPHIVRPSLETFAAGLSEITDDAFGVSTEDKNHLRELKRATMGISQDRLRQRFADRRSVALELLLRAGYR